MHPQIRKPMQPMPGMMILAYYIFIGLLSSTSGQTVVISLSNDYVNKTGTVTITCAVVADVISDTVEIAKDGIVALRCPSPPIPCSSTIAAYSAVQDETAGTTTMTINPTNISRDKGNWTCQHGRTSSSKAASLMVGTPLSITKMNELNTTAVIETSCTFPYAGVNVSCSVGETDINCQYNISSSATCGDLNERVLTITIYLDLFKGSASGFLTVHIANGFTAVLKTGNHNYTFTATTTTGVTTDDGALKCIQTPALVVGLVNGIICVICLIFIVILVKRVNIHTEDELQNLRPDGSEKTITASVRGIFISSVQWTGPYGNISTSSGKYNITYDRKTGISTLQISAFEINDSGLYICHAKGVCGSSVQDSVRISVYDATDPNTYTTNPKAGASKHIPEFGLGIICVTCIVSIIILAMSGKPCALELGLVLGLGLLIPSVVIVILVFKVYRPITASEQYGWMPLCSVGRTGQQSDGSEYADELKKLEGKNIA